MNRKEMLVLGHAGMTLGAFLIVEEAARRYSGSQQSHSAVAGPSATGKIASETSFYNHFDLRLLLLGSLLPDIIDKPIGQYFFADTFSSGRIFGHSLLFAVILAVIGVLVLATYRKTWGVVLSFGVFAHLILDQMWSLPQTLFWPAYGAFEREDLTGWTWQMIRNLVADPGVFVPELIGGIVLLWFAWSLLHRKKLESFVRAGIH